MTKIAIVSDCHVANFPAFGGPKKAGLNSRCDIALDVLDQAYEKALKEDCKVFMIAGDLFDTDRPTPQIITAAQELFSKEIFNAILVGTHDPTSFTEKDHALGPLQDRCKIIDKPHIIRDPRVAIISIPVQEGNASDYLISSLESLRNDLQKIPANNKQILVTHIGISDSDTSAYLKDGTDSISVSSLKGICEDFGISYVFSGHWHSRKIWHNFKHVNIVQLGALCPTGFDNPGFEGYGTLLIFDTDSNDYAITEIPGPRFIKANLPRGTDSDEWVNLVTECSAQKKTLDTKIFLKVTTTPKNVIPMLVRAQGIPAENFGDTHLFSEVIVLVDKEVTEQAAREAATAAKSAKTLIQSVEAFVSKMPLDQGVNRKNVLARAKKYLGV